jgi:hypothetical protein
MLTRIVNLICASFALLFALDLQFGFLPSRYPPQGPHLPTTVSGILFYSIVAFWIVGAVGLLFRRRFAWICSLIGVAASACFFTVVLAVVVGMWLFTSAHDLRSGPSFGITGILATVITIIIGVGGLSVLSAFFVAVFIGLVRMRKELR